MQLKLPIPLLGEPPARLGEQRVDLETAGLVLRPVMRLERHGLGRGKIVIPEDALDDYRKAHTVGAEGGRPKAPPPPVRIRLNHLELS